MMNELNKRANLLMEQLEVITFPLVSLSVFLCRSKRIHLQTSMDVVVMEHAEQNVFWVNHAK